MVALLLSSLAFVGCKDTETTTPTVPTTDDSKYGGTMKMISPSSASGVIGWPSEAGVGGWSTVFLTTDRLVEIDTQGNILPSLATSWDIAPDGTSITFTLRDDVKFHDGTDFNAEAAKWNLEFWMAAHKAGTMNWTSIEAPDTYTLRINLTTYQNTILSSLATYYCGYMSPTAFEEHGKDWMIHNPVGTGPFKMVSLEADVGQTFVRNDDWWGVKPYLEKIEYMFVKDAMTAKMLFMDGEAHAIQLSGWPLSEVKAIQDAGYELVPFKTGGGMMYLITDSANSDSPFAKQEVREALDYAIDRDELAALGLGFWQPLYQLAPRPTIGHNPELEGARPYDPDKAIQLLADAGYEDGIDTTLVAPFWLWPNDAVVAVKGYLADVGIRTTIENPPIPRFFEMVNTGWEGIILLGSPPSPDFLARIEAYVSTASTSAASALKPAEMQTLLNEALAARTLEEKTALAKQIVKMVFDMSLITPVLEQGPEFAVTDQLHDHGLGDRGMSYWSPEKAWLSD
jgi:ABC-type transport system substrate-binding protein